MESVTERQVAAGVNLIAEDVARAEIRRFADGMDLDLDDSNLDDEDKTQLNKHINKLTRSIQRGNLVINDNDEAVYTPFRHNSKYKEAITFHERTGASLMATDGKKKDQDVKKTYAVMASMCGVEPKVFAGLSGTDIKVCESIFALLMD